MHTEVILLEDLGHKGKKGDVVRVKLGFGKYLLEQKKALRKTKGTEFIVNQIKKKAIKLQAKELADAKSLAELLADKVLNFTGKVHEEKLYGSISAQDIQQKLEEVLKIKLDKKKINVVDHLKELGEHEIIINLLPEVQAKIKVVISAEK